MAIFSPLQHVVPKLLSIGFHFNDILVVLSHIYVGTHLSLMNSGYIGMSTAVIIQSETL